MTEKQTHPVILLFGPSRVGKTTLAEQVAKDLDFLHLNFDYDGDFDSKGIDANTNIQKVWQEFFDTYQMRPLNEGVDRLVREKGKSGAMATFPSNIFPTLQHIRSAQENGSNAIILQGPKDACIAAFLERESKNGRNLGLEHWNEFNTDIYEEVFSNAAYEPYIETAFEKDDRRALQSLVDAVRSRIQEN